MSETASEPRLSATILLLRDAGEMQVLMVKRHHRIDFASGALVFPGGKANDEDASPEWSGLSDCEHSAEPLSVRIAAIRECYEESGILLARSIAARGAGRPLVGVDVAERLDPFRSAVDRGEQSFLDLVRDHELVLATDTLVHFGHWVTPTLMPKRFDTHFFIAATPDAQIARQDGRETTLATWLSPGEALRQESSGEATIIFPTRMNLKRLALVSDTKAAMSRFADAPVPRVLPEMTEDEDGNPCLRIPEVEGYGQTLEPLENVKDVAGPGHRG
ncbi:MAG: NUDIX domain-containing protein [Alphaproteobacteria bacterium]|jgi:8-oxo-dGTP pyrophosphatase MutT (NUDIX family)|nr:NUDIX domain-containing protein [Alphaproteobacteria bacterium]